MKQERPQLHVDLPLVRLFGCSSGSGSKNKNQMSRDLSSENSKKERRIMIKRLIEKVLPKKLDRSVCISRFRPIRELVKTSIEAIGLRREFKAGMGVSGIPSGFTNLDRLTSGFRKGDLILIAGRPSMGKTTLALNIAESVGVTGKIPVAIFSLDISGDQLAQRMLCSHTKVNIHKARTGFLSTPEWSHLTAIVGKLSEAPIFIDDTPALSVMELQAKIRKLKAQQDIQLIILDYLQLMHANGDVKNRRREIFDISRSLKSLACELSIPLIAISQLSSIIESRQDSRPYLSDVRELNRCADEVLFLHREDYYNPTESNRGSVEIIVAQNRRGPIGTTNLAFLHEYLRFENIPTRERK